MDSGGDVGCADVNLSLPRGALAARALEVNTGEEAADDASPFTRAISQGQGAECSPFSRAREQADASPFSRARGHVERSRGSPIQSDGSTSQTGGGSSRKEQTAPKMMTADLFSVESGEPSSPQAEQMLRAKRAGSPGNSGSPGAMGASAQGNNDGGRASLPGIVSRTPPPIQEHDFEPSSPQAETLLRTKRNSGASSRSPNNTRPSGAQPSAPQVVEEPQDREFVPDFSDEPSSPQAAQLFRRKRGSKGSPEAQVPHAAAEGHEASRENSPGQSSEGLRQDYLDQISGACATAEVYETTSEISSPQARGHYRAKRSSRGPHSGSKYDQQDLVRVNSGSNFEQEELDAFVGTNASPADIMWQQGADEPSSPQAQKMVTTKRRHSRQHSTTEDPSQGVHPVPVLQAQAQEGFMQDELDMMSRNFQTRDNAQEEDWGEGPSSPQARQMMKAKRQSQSRSPDRTEEEVQTRDARTISGSSGGSVEEDQWNASAEASAQAALSRSAMDADGELCSPQAQQMRRAKQLRQRGMQASHAEPQQAESFPPPAPWPIGCSEARPGITQADLDAIAATPLGMCQGPAPQQVQRPSRTPSPYSGSDGLEAEMRGATSAYPSINRTQQSVGSTHRQLSRQELDALHRTPHAAWGPEHGLHQNALDDLAHSQSAPMGNEQFLWDEPSSPQASSLRKKKANHQGQVGQSPGNSVSPEGATQAEFGNYNEPLGRASLASASEVFAPYGDEPSSPQAAQIRRAKRINSPPQDARMQMHHEQSPAGSQDARLHPPRPPPGEYSDHLYHQGINQAQLDALCGTFGNSVDEDPWSLQEPSSPQSNQLRRKKRSNSGDPGLNRQLSNGAETADTYEWSQGRQGSNSSSPMSADSPRSPLTEALRDRRTAAAPTRGFSNSSLDADFRPRPPAYGAAYQPRNGITQAELDQLAYAHESSPRDRYLHGVSSSSPQNDYDRPGQTFSQQKGQDHRGGYNSLPSSAWAAVPHQHGLQHHYEPEPQYYYGGVSDAVPMRTQMPGLTQAELNALSHGEGSPRHVSVIEVEPNSPQASQMQRSKKSTRFTGVPGTKMPSHY